MRKTFACFWISMITVVTDRDRDTSDDIIDRLFIAKKSYDTV